MNRRTLVVHSDCDDSSLGMTCTQKTMMTMMINNNKEYIITMIMITSSNKNGDHDSDNDSNNDSDNNNKNNSNNSNTITDVQRKVQH